MKSDPQRGIVMSVMINSWQIQKCFDLIQRGDGLQTTFLSLTLANLQRIKSTIKRRQGKF